MYIGTTEPWLSARVGPQLVSAYVETVLVRPGASVKRGDVIATLDCRNASAASQAVSMMARAIETKQKAAAKEAARLSELVEGGYIAANEVDKKLADSASQQAELLATKAKILGTSLQVNDCVLKAPFDGEIAERFADPGTFARPGTALVTLVDRSTVRVRIDVPEADFELIPPGAQGELQVLATSRELRATIMRRSPTADPSTRTVRAELDVVDPQRSIPVGTTARVTVPAGKPVPALAVPLNAAVVKRGKALLFVVDDGVAYARTIRVLGEQGDTLYLEPTLPKDAHVVVEGRAMLRDGDRVVAHVDPASSDKTEAMPAASAATFPMQ